MLTRHTKIPDLHMLIINLIHPSNDPKESLKQKYALRRLISLTVGDLEKQRTNNIGEVALRSTYSLPPKSVVGYTTAAQRQSLEPSVACATQATGTAPPPHQPSPF